MIAIDRRRPRPGEPGSEAEADGPDSQPLDTPEPAQLRPNITATTAGGPFAQVPTPQIGAPNSQPVLRAPEPTTPPAQSLSVAQTALGSAKPGTQAAPMFGGAGGVSLPGLGVVSGGPGTSPPAQPQTQPAPPINPAWVNTTTAGGPQGQVAPGSMIPPTPQVGAPIPTLSAPGAPSQTQSFNLPNAATQFPGADGKGNVSGGGSSGQFWQAFDQSQSAPLSPEEQSKATRIMQGDQSLMNEYKQQYGNGWFEKWGADQNMYAKRLTNQTATAGDINALAGMSGEEAWDVISGKTTIGGSQDGSQMGTNYMNALRAMTTDQRRQFLSQWPEGSRNRALIEGSLAAQGIAVDNADTGQRWEGKTQNNGPFASAVPVYSNDVRGTGVNSQGLAGYGTPTPQIAPPPGTGGYDPGNAGGGVTATPGKINTTTGGTGGSGGAPVVGGGPSGAPAFPSTPAPGVGAPGDLTNLDPVQQAMRDETLRRLQNPSPYDDALWQKEVDRAKLSSDEQWKRNRDSLDADLAARGINFSSIAGDKLSDFNTARSRSWDDTLTGFLSDRAKGIGSARDQAFNAGNTERTYYDDQRQRGIDNQFDVTRLAEALRQGQEGTALDWTRLGLDALGNSTAGAADLGAGAAASAGQTGTQDYITQWLAQFYGNKKPTPQTGAPSTVNYGMQ